MRIIKNMKIRNINLIQGRVELEGELVEVTAELNDEEMKAVRGNRELEVSTGHEVRDAETGEVMDVLHTHKEDDRSWPPKNMETK